MTTSPARMISPQLLMAAGYFLAGQVGLWFLLPGTDISLVWPAAGVALALTFLLGYRVLPGLALGSMLLHLSVDHSLAMTVAVTTGNVVGAALGVWVLRGYRVNPALDRLRDMLALVLAVAAASGVTSLVGAGALSLMGEAQWQGFGSLWWVCWVADLMGALLVVPVLLSLAAGHLRLERPLEVGLMTVAVAATSWVVYADLLPEGVAMTKPISYVVFPLMIWAAVRLRAREVALLLMLHAAIAIYLTAGGGGPFAMETLRENLLSLHTHLAMLGLSALLLTAAMSERWSAEAQLRESEAKYRLLVENQTDMVVKTDRDGRALFVSPSFCELLGEPEGRLLGQSLRRLLQPGDQPAADQAWSALFGPPHASYIEHPLQTVHGQRWLAWAAKAVLAPDGEVCAIVAVGRDVTDRRQAEERARQHLQELAHVGRISAMGEMAAGLAHELNQPLCAITSFSQACSRLLGPDADPDLRYAIERVAANATRAGAIISQMRAFVRKDAPEFRPADLNRLVEDVVSLVGPEARQHGVSLEQELGRDLPAVAVAEIQVHQVLVNLLRNAIDAISGADSPRRQIRIRTRRRPEGVEVTVTDSGPGLPAGLLDQVFEPFVSTKPGGMGLGLSISRSIIEAHGGSLLAQAAPGGGAEFRFVLPVAEARQAQAG